MVSKKIISNKVLLAVFTIFILSCQSQSVDVGPEKEYSVEGQIFFPNLETNIGDVKVSIIGLDNDISKTDITDATGIYQIGGLESGNYRIIAEHNSEKEMYTTWEEELNIFQDDREYNMILGKKYYDLKKVCRMFAYGISINGYIFYYIDREDIISELNIENFDQIDSFETVVRWLYANRMDERGRAAVIKYDQDYQTLCSFPFDPDIEFEYEGEIVDRFFVEPDDEITTIERERIEFLANLEAPVRFYRRTDLFFRLDNTGSRFKVNYSF
jgi:hypothetical protein